MEDKIIEPFSPKKVAFEILEMVSPHEQAAFLKEVHNIILHVHDDKLKELNQEVANVQKIINSLAGDRPANY